MKNIYVSIIGIVLAASSIAVADEDGQYDSWTFRRDGRQIITFSVGEYSTKHSGWYKLENLTSHKFERICWKIYHKNGSSDTGCSPLDSYEEKKSSHYPCGTDNEYGGCSDVDITSVE